MPAPGSWLFGLKFRFGVRLLKVSGKKLSSDTEAVELFKHKLSNIIYELKLCNAQIYNADESGLIGKMFPERSYLGQAEKAAPWRKAEKDRTTFMACINATVQHKDKPLIRSRSLLSHNIPVYYMNSSENGSLGTMLTMDIKIQCSFKHYFFVFSFKSFCNRRAYKSKLFYCLTMHHVICRKMSLRLLIVHICDLYAIKCHALDSDYGPNCKLYKKKDFLF